MTVQVIRHIRSLIDRGQLQAGDRLPPERELARKLHISRASLRAGIGFLAAMGILQSRHGAGTFIAQGPPAFDALSMGVLAALHDFQPAQMFEARLTVEKTLAAFAAERATEEHLALLAEEVAEMYAALADPQKYLIHDVRFHRTVAAASGNPILATLMEAVTGALYDYRRKTVERAQDLKESAEMHHEIFRAIRVGNAKRAATAMERHLRLAQAAQSSEPQQTARKKGDKGGERGQASDTSIGSRRSRAGRRQP